MVVYDIKLLGNQLISEKVDNFDDVFGCVNRKVIYDVYDSRYHIYSDKNHFQQCKQRLLKILIKEQTKIIKEANNQLLLLRSVEI